MKRVFICLLAVMMLMMGVAAAAPAAPSGDAIGVIDLNKIMAASPKIKAYQEQLNQKGKDLGKQLEAEKSKLTPEQFEKKKEEAYKAFTKFKEELEAQIDNSVRQATEQVAKEKNLRFIFYKNAVAFSSLDVTQDVINKMK